jgi:hypothetical protein
VTFKLKSERRKGVIHVKSLGKNIPGREKSKFKGISQGRVWRIPGAEGAVWLEDGDCG